MRRISSISIAALTAVLALSGCDKAPVGAPPVDTAKVAAEVKAAIKTQVDAYATRDVETAASILAPDVRTMFHGAPDVIGKAAATDAIKAQMADPAVKLAIANEAVDVAAAGDMAIHRATYAFTHTDPVSKKPAVEVGNWVSVFKRQPDGSMKLSSDMVMDTPNVTPAAP